LSTDPPHLPASPPRQRLPWWGPDLQTLRDTIRPQRLAEDRSSAITIDLGRGEALLGRLSSPDQGPVAGLVVLIPGLGGCSEGLGVRRLANDLGSAGFAVLRLNMRGAGAGRDLASGTYAACCNRDLLPALMRARELAAELAHQQAGQRAEQQQGQAGNPVPSFPLFGVGLSLGGTMLLNGQLEKPLLDGLVCVSSPLDLARCSQQFDRPRNRLYRRWVLRRLRQLTLADPRGALAEELSALSGPERVKTLRAFDARITSPRWGYNSVDGYYAAASPLQPLLTAVETGSAMPPTLLIHAADDPWVPVAATRQLAAAAQRRGCPWLETMIPAHGGHNGFHSRDPIGWADGGSTASWADRQTTAWLKGLVQRLG